MTPKECLEKQLDVWKGALRSSQKSCQIGTITQAQHEIHRKNLEPKIHLYEQAIEVLRKNSIP